MKDNHNTQSLWINNAINELRKRADLLEKGIVFANKQIDRAPEGGLKITTKGNSMQCYHRTDLSSTGGAYISKKNIKIAYELAQKDYNQRYVKEAQKELSLIRKYLSKIEPDNIESIYTSLGDARKSFVTPFIEDLDSYIVKWLHRDFQPGYFEPGSPEHYTDKNERVRSKSEVEIANALNNFKIPYIYEYPLEINGIQYRPDFHCLNVRTRKEIIWEHYGMMDDISYARDNIDKLYTYESAGYMPGDNFIVTFETSRHPINVKILKRIIDYYLS